MGESATGGNLTRREMLKKSALVGAVAWTAPIVGSFNTPARAQEVVSPAACTDWNCGEPHDICGSSGPLNRCLCDVDVNGDVFCWEDTFCVDSQDCTSNADCPPGWRCSTNCCGTTCMPECGTNATSVNAQNEGQLTASGGR